MQAIYFSANNTMHFAWCDTNEVSAGTTADHEAKRSRQRFTIKPFEGKPMTIEDLVSISSNDAMHFAWHIELTPKGDPDYHLWVCTGPSVALGAKRDWYRSRLPRGANPENLRYITSNNNMHFAWFQKGTELWVGRGSSNDLDKHDTHHCILPPEVKIDHILYMASNDKLHFAFLKNGTFLTGSSNKLDHVRPDVYDLEEMRDIFK